MTSLSQSLNALTMFGPELGLFVILIFHLVFDLCDTINPQKFIRSMIVGLLFIFVILLLLWPYTGVALYGMFRLDPFATLLKAIFTFSGIATLLMAGEFIPRLGERANDFCLIILTALLGSFFLAASTDLVTLFITIEWMTISLYILTSFLKSDSYSLEAGIKYLIMGAFSSALFLYGISFVYGAVGSLFFADIRQFLSIQTSSLIFTAGFFLILSGIGFKIAMFPFHLWAPDVYEGAPTPVTAFLSLASKTAGFAALLKFLFLAVGPEFLNWPHLLLFLSAITLSYGNLVALRQTNMKRLFAYSSLGHVGYLLMGIAVANRLGLEAALYYLMAYALATSAAFLVIVIANRELGSSDIVTYRGLAKRSPFLAGIFFVALLSLSGIPPLAGFFAKFLILNAVVLKGYFWLALIGAVNMIISLYYYLSIVKEMYFGGKQPSSKDEIQLSRWVQIFLLCLAAAMILLGIVQEPVLHVLHFSVSALLV